MTTLLSWYPGDHFVVLALKILLQVTVVILAALAIARPLRHKPAARYWALFALRQFSQAISADFKAAAQELNSVLE